MNEFNKKFPIACQDEEQEVANHCQIKEEMEQFSDNPEVSHNPSALTGLAEQNQENGEKQPLENHNSDEIIEPSNKQVSSITRNRNTPKKKRFAIDPEYETTNYKTNEKKTKGEVIKKPRRENKINHYGSACLREIVELLNKICEKYRLRLKSPNFQKLFSKNYLYHKQFMEAKIYQILIKILHENKEVIDKIVFEIGDLELIYILNLTFEFICKYFSEEKIDNDILIDEKKDIAIKALEAIAEQIIEEMKIKGGFTKEEINEKKDAFKICSQEFFKEFAKKNKRKPKNPEFQFDELPYIEKYFN